MGFELNLLGQMFEGFCDSVLFASVRILRSADATRLRYGGEQ